MASLKVKNVCILFLVLIICQQIFVEGRHLWSKSYCKKCSAQPDDNSFKVPVNGDYGGEERSSKVEKIDDFRPTTPGHSPGAGHSIKT
ncbi:Detected protein of unknown function [Hibiscus syriacus]|uniref:Uncharacterized protein n=1 Tax=Hibiscus syriacus TaxID=106335 RepID=A0A6A3C371_HIBSY|nr:Detected protein of unknown function [Hibiscus syriacus]